MSKHVGLVMDEKPSQTKEPTVTEIKEMLDSLGIEYNSNAKKKELVELLEKHKVEPPVGASDGNTNAQ